MPYRAAVQRGSKLANVYWLVTKIGDENENSNMTEEEQKIYTPMDQNNIKGTKMLSVSRSVIRPHMRREYKDAYTNNYDATPIYQYPTSQY